MVSGDNGSKSKGSKLNFNIVDDGVDDVPATPLQTMAQIEEEANNQIVYACLNWIAVNLDV